MAARCVAIATLIMAGSGGGSVAAEPIKLYDFGKQEALAQWWAINDGVMGGVSSGGMQDSGEETALFTGVVSLENNGGFASVRSRPKEWDLGASAGIMLKIRGDGGRYKFNLRTDAAFDGILYVAPFETTAGKWQTVRLPFDRFRASFRGRAMPDAALLDPSRIVSLGLLISDKQAGPFRLEIAWIGTYAE
jgi:monofunctional biosynthetic peptidoglycan transglycosylase